MAIIIERTITIKNDNATLDKPLYLYIEDGDIDCLFSIKDKEKTARFGSVNTTDYSVIDKNNIDYGQVRIYKPDPGSDSTSRLVFTNRAEVMDDKLYFTFSSKNIDDFSEAGIHKLQIHLYDNDDNRLTIPPVDLYVLMPVGCDNNTIDEAIVGYSLLDKTGEEVPTFIDGNYNKIEWKTGDIITSNRLNKIEDALYEINAADNDFVTSEELETKLAGKANVSHPHTVSNISGLARVATSGSYNDLTNKPTIPDISNFATKAELDGHTHSQYLTSIPSSYVTETELMDELDIYATKTYVNNKVAEAQISGGGNSNIDLSGYATKDDLLDYATKDDLYDKADRVHTHSQYLTEQSIAGMVTSNTITRIEVVENLPTDEDPTVLYIVKK